MKKKTIISFTAAMTAAVMASSQVPCIASGESDKLFFDAFDEYRTNEKASSLVVSSMSRVEQVAENNKALLICDENKHTKITADISKNASDKIYISFDLFTEKAPLDAFVSITDNQKGFIPMYVKGGIIYANNGDEIGKAEPGVFMNILVECDFSRRIYSIYKDGVQILKSGKIDTSFVPSSVSITREYSKDGNVLKLDNFYIGTKPIGEGENIAEFNEAVSDYIPLDYDAGDYKYFDSKEINTSLVQYPYTEIVENGNTIKCGRFDYKNPSHKQYIYMSKTKSSECYMKFYIEKQVHYMSSKNYQNFIMSADIKSDKLGAETDLFTLIDIKNYALPKMSKIATITPTGGIETPKGTLMGVFRERNWVNIKLAVNINDHTADLYIDNKLRQSDIPIDEKIKQIDAMQILMNKGRAYGDGDLYLDNMTIWGTVNPYENGEYEREDIYVDDTPVEEYLKDKVSFHAYSDIMYKDGTKQDISDKSEYDEENNIYYVTPDIIKASFGADVEIIENAVEYNGRRYEIPLQNGKISVKDFAQKVLSKQVLDDKNGMFIFSDSNINLDTSNEKLSYEKPYIGSRFDEPTTIESLNDFLFYERPTSDELEKLFNETAAQTHPRIMATQDDFDRVRELCKTDERLNKMKDKLIKKADGMLPETVQPVSFKFGDQYRMIGEAFNFVDRMKHLGFAYKMTDDRKYFDRAWKELESISQFPNLNTNHPLDTGIFTTGLAIGYDWFYDVFTDEQRETVKNTIIELSVKPMYNAYYGGMLSQCAANPGWVYTKWTSNYNPIINGGTMLGALAVAEDIPEISFDYAENVIRALEYYIRGLAPDGAWVEGYSYWGFALEYFQPTIETLKTTFGTDFGLMKHKGLDKTADFAIALQGPEGVNTFSDADQEASTGSPYYTWFGNLYNNRSISALRKWYIDKGAMPDVDEMFLYDPDIDVSEAENVPKGLLTHGTESFAIRSSYEDSNALYVSAHFGNTGGFHSHMDCGTFVLDMLGERWAVDLGKGNYNRKYPQTQEYRYRAESHNVLVINPDQDPGQIYNRFAPVTRFETNDASGFAIADESAIYEEVNSAYRGYYVGDNMKSVTVRDEIDLKEKSTVYWFMTTRADVHIEGNEAILIQNGKTLSMKFATNAKDAELMVMPSKPLDTSPNPDGQPKETGSRKIAIKMTADGKTNITVKFAQMGTPESGVVSDIPMSEWKLEEVPQNVEKEDLGFKFYVDNEEFDYTKPVPVHLDGSMPEISVVTNTEGLKTEVYEAKDVNDITKVKIYSKDESYYNIAYIKYSDAGYTMMKYYDELPISSFEASSNAQPENSVQNAFDNNFNTRWTSLVTDEYITVDLGEKKDIDGIAMAFWKGDTRVYDYVVAVSDDGKNFKEIATGANTTGDSNYYIQRFYEKVQARFIRVIGKGNSDNVNTNILEMRILKLK